MGVGTGAFHIHTTGYGRMGRAATKRLTSMLRNIAYSKIMGWICWGIVKMVLYMLSYKHKSLSLLALLTRVRTAVQNASSLTICIFQTVDTTATRF